MGLCFAGILVLALGTVLADDDKEKKEGEAQEHAVAKKVLAAAKIDLLAAVKVALQELPDGKAFLAETEEEDGMAIFEVHVLVGDKIKEVMVDAVTGKVIKAKEDKEEKEDNADEVKEAKAALAKTKTTLAAAIESALKDKENAKAFEASIEMEEEDEVEVLVEYFDGDKVMEAKIDPATGKVLKVEEEKDEKKE